MYMSVREGHRRGVPALVVLAAVAIVWTASVAPEAKTDINVDYDKTFSFAGLRSWAWHPDGAGDVRLAISSQDDPARVAARVDPIILPAVERELTVRGLARVDNGGDLHVHYYMLGTVGDSTQIQGQFLPATTNWGLPPFLAQTTALSVYPVGTLIIDVTSPASGAIVWRGSAARKLDLEKPDTERRKTLERAISDLFKKFPPKK
jgi:Domain of unknown function (DUF4136)